MEPKTEKCIIDKNGIAKICVDENNFNFSYTDDIKEKMRTVLNEKQKTIPEQERQKIVSAIASLDDPSKNRNVIPHDKIKMAGIFSKADTKDEMLLALSIDPDFSTSIHMKNSYALIPIGKDEAAEMDEAIPKKIIRAKDMDDLLASLS